MLITSHDHPVRPETADHTSAEGEPDGDEAGSVIRIAAVIFPRRGPEQELYHFIGAGPAHRPSPYHQEDPDRARL
jgi:hypothetical protein